MMKKHVVLLLTLCSLLSCDKNKDEATMNKTTLLAGGSQKTWYLYSESDEDVCTSAIDDSWIFFADGSFEYDHGTITEDEENNCSDLVNLTGDWTFTTDETALEVWAREEKGNPANNLDTKLISGTISKLTEDQLIINYNNTIIEFRKR